MAWKVDTRLAVLVKTDMRNFSQLILSTFLQNNYVMNDNLPLLRVQTVHVDGTPQDFDEILSHSRKDIVAQSSVLWSADDWEKHLDWIKNLSVLANQASEFEYKKNLTEGKTGIVQPDLISSKNIEESLLHAVTSPDTPKKKMLSLEKTREKIHGLKVDLERQELLKSPLNPTASFPKTPDNGHVPEQKIVTPESPKFPTASPAKSPTPSVRSKVSVEPQSPKFPTGSPAKKPAIWDNDKPSIVKMEPKILKMEEEKQTHEVVDSKKTQQNVKQATANLIESEKSNPAPALVKEKPASVETKPLPALVGKKPAASVEVKPVELKKLDPSPTKPKPLNLPPIATSEPQQVTQEPPKLPPSKSSQSIRRKRHQLIMAKPPNIVVYSDSTTTRDNVIKTLGSILQKNTYTIYPLTAQQVRSRIWLDNTSLLVVCGSVNGSDVGSIFLDFFFRGGKVLCLCSDLLGHVLPTYHTAEVC